MKGGNILEIVIGSAPPVGSPRTKASRTSNTVEATILDVRNPRQRYGTLPVGTMNRRGGNNTQDPFNGKVMLLLVPDENEIPKDLENGNYKVIMRFVPGKHKGTTPKAENSEVVPLRELSQYSFIR